MSKLCKDCACENVCGITHLPEDKACGFYYKADAITELEEIKTEIKELKKEWDFFDDYRKGEGLYYASKIIDKHIEELKGENNEL